MTATIEIKVSGISSTYPELETRVIGGLMTYPELVNDCSLTPEHFEDNFLGNIYFILKELASSQRKINPFNICSLLPEADYEEDTAGHLTYLVGQIMLQGSIGTALKENIEKLDQNVKSRELMTILSYAQKKLLEGEIPDYVMNEIVQASQSFQTIKHRSQTLESGFDTMIQNLEKKLKGEYNFLSTGIPQLDDLMGGGFHAAELVILGGSTSMGKTAFAMSILMEIASQGHPVAFFSLEMPLEQLAQRTQSRYTGLTAQQIRNGKVPLDRFGDIVEARTKVAQMKIAVDDCGGLSMEVIRGEAKRLKAQNGIKILVIDYLGLIKPTHRSGNRYQEVTQISNDLKSLALELQLPILCLAQLSRKERENNRPFLSDLRDTGAIEQDADVVMFVHREHYYLERQKKQPGEKGYEEWERKLYESEGKTEVIIAKNRMGEIGDVLLEFNSKTTTFTAV